LPLYEYECPQCGLFERMQKFSDPILKKCPTCKKRVEKLISAPAIQFKGTGWYVTDYTGKSSGGKDKDATAAESKSTSDKDNTAAKSDSKSSSKKSSDSSKE
jgi:putative FmdB family regulatory protein